MMSKFLCLSLFLLVGFTQSLYTESNGLNLDDYAYGLLQAYGDSSFEAQISRCLIEAEFAGALAQGMNLVNTKDPAQVEAGIHRIGDWFTIFYRGFVLCQAGTQAVRNDILDLVQSFKSAKAVSYVKDQSLMIDGVEVISHITAALDAYYNGHNDIDTGLFIGTAMMKVVHNRKSLYTESNGLNLDDYAYGFLQAYGDSSFEAQISRCLIEAEFAGALAQGMNLINTKDPAQVEAGIHRIGDWFTIFYRGFVLCQAGTQAVRNDILDLVQSFKSAKAVSYIKDQSLMIDGVQVHHQIMAALDAYYNGHNDIDTGLFLGTAMMQVVHYRG